MKYIIAVIQPHRLDAVRQALSTIGVQGMTVTEVRGFGRQKGQTEIYRGAEYTMNYVPKVKIEIAVSASLADQVVEAIGEAAQDRPYRRRQGVRARSRRGHARPYRRDGRRRAVI